MNEADIKAMNEDLQRQAEAVPDDFSEWYWYGLKEKLAGGDIMKMKVVGKQNFIDCLRLLAYWDKRDKDIAKEIKKQREQANQNILRNSF